MRTSSTKKRKEEKRSIFYMSMFDVKLWQQFDNTFNLSHRAIQLMFRIISKRYQGHERIVLGFFSPARRCRVAIATNKRALR